MFKKNLFKNALVSIQRRQIVGRIYAMKIEDEIYEYPAKAR